MKIGMAYDNRIPIVPIDVTAPKATEDPNDGKIKTRDRKVPRLTARMGHMKISLTLLKNRGFVKRQLRNWN